MRSRRKKTRTSKVISFFLLYLTGGLGASPEVALPFKAPSANVFRSSDIQFSRYYEEIENTPSLLSRKSEGVERIYFLLFQKFFKFIKYALLTIIDCLLRNAGSDRPFALAKAFIEEGINQFQLIFAE